MRDQGPGIPAAHRDQIFERVYRIETDRGPHNWGTGLGLAIVKGTAEKHGGWVEVESEVGHGSTFRMVFPNA